MQESIQIELYGDSIAKGVIFDEARGRYALAKERVTALIEREKPVVINSHARMGATTTDALDELSHEERRDGAIAVIEFGGNDCDMNWKEVAEAPDQPHDARVPPSVFSRQLAQLVSIVRSLGMRSLLVLPPPLDAKRYFNWVTRGINASGVLAYLSDVEHIYRWHESYVCIVSKTAHELGCPVLDLRSPMLTDHHFSALLCCDGIHPSEAGHKIMAQAILSQWDALQSALSGDF